MRILSALLWVLLPPLAFLPAQETLRVDVDLVGVFLTVHDSDGAYVSGLERDDFRVFEDGEERLIEVFETGDDVESSLGILIDNSGSSADILSAVRTGVMGFASRLASEDEVFVMSFGTETEVIHDFGEPRESLRQALEGLRSWGTSVFFDALDSGIRKVSRAGNTRKALIVLTDGGDNRSLRTYREVVQAAESRMVMLYFIGMGPPILVDTYTLQGLASMTGGRVFLMSGSQSPGAALDAIRDDLSRQYYLGYYSPAGPGNHAIEVEVPGGEFTVRAREGYTVDGE